MNITVFGVPTDALAEFASMLLAQDSLRGHTVIVERPATRFITGAKRVSALTGIEAAKGHITKDRGGVFVFYHQAPDLLNTNHECLAFRKRDELRRLTNAFAYLAITLSDIGHSVVKIDHTMTDSMKLKELKCQMDLT